MYAQLREALGAAASRGGTRTMFVRTAPLANTRHHLIHNDDLSMTYCGKAIDGWFWADAPRPWPVAGGEVAVFDDDTHEGPNCLVCALSASLTDALSRSWQTS